MIDGKTRLLCLLGSPIAHSFSPAMHNAAFKKLGINAAYMAFDIPSTSIENTLDGLKEINFIGANFTSPHKNAVIPFLDSIDSLALKIGAVNTVAYKDGQLFGYNTDVLGFIEALKIRDINLNDIKVCILGTGGAAQAAAVGLFHQCVKSIDIISRQLHKSEEMVKKLDLDILYSKTYSNIKDAETYDLIVNATPLGMHPFEGQSPIVVSEFGHENTVYYDLVYNPAESEFLRQVRMLNRKAINGLDMLIYQGIYALKYWYDIDEELWTRDDVLTVLRNIGIVNDF